MPSPRRPWIVLTSLVVAMTGSTVFLQVCLPSGAATREPAGITRIAARPEPLSPDTGAPRRNWKRIEIHFAGDAGDPDLAGAGDVFHFVIGGADADVGTVAAVRPLWRRQGPSALAGSDEHTVHIALVGSGPGTSPTPSQWQTLGLLVRHLQERFGRSGVQFDPHLDADPLAQDLRVAAGW